MLLFNACEKPTTPQEKLLIATKNLDEYQRLHSIEIETLQGYNAVYDSLMVFFGASEDSSFRNLSMPVLEVVREEIKNHTYSRDTLHEKIVEYSFNIQQYGDGQKQPVELKEP